MKSRYSILVNTCDKFEDCWLPFFKLFATYWANCEATIYLNTEYKTFSYENLPIVSTQVCMKKGVPHGQRASWSQCFRWALEQIETDIVLYMQEDYFIKGDVDNEQIEHFVAFMNENPDIKCLHLTDQAIAEYESSKYDRLKNVKYKQAYRVSCQAALWRKEELLQLLTDWESGWQFEKYASRRSGIMRSRYLVVDSQWAKLGHYEIIPYVFTGIIQGKWNEDVVSLFKQNDIDIDFSVRGFTSEIKNKSFIKRVKYRIDDTLCYLRNVLLMCKLLLKK